MARTPRREHMSRLLEGPAAQSGRSKSVRNRVIVVVRIGTVEPAVREALQQF